jgi:hypothetical protein
MMLISNAKETIVGKSGGSGCGVGNEGLIEPFWQGKMLRSTGKYSQKFELLCKYFYREPASDYIVSLERSAA